MQQTEDYCVTEEKVMSDFMMFGMPVLASNDSVLQRRLVERESLGAVVRACGIFALLLAVALTPPRFLYQCS